MAEALYLNIHVILAEIIACILCVILVFVVFCQTIYYLCIHKLIHAFYAKDETDLNRFEYSDDFNADIFAITTASSSELDASLLAPCIPV